MPLSRLDILREELKGRLSERRYVHTIGVEQMAEHLGKIFFDGDISSLRAAALLHDVAKELPREEQLALIREKFQLTRDDLSTEGALHSFAAIPVIEREFPEFASPDILEAVFHHTLGDANMNLFTEIIFISDFIENGRQYEGSIRTRERLFAAINSSSTRAEAILALHRAVIDAINYTIDSLKRRGLSINSRTVKTKDAFLALI